MKVVLLQRVLNMKRRGCREGFGTGMPGQQEGSVRVLAACSQQIWSACSAASLLCSGLFMFFSQCLFLTVTLLSLHLLHPRPRCVSGALNEAGQAQPSLSHARRCRWSLAVPSRLAVAFLFLCARGCLSLGSRWPLQSCRSLK